VVKDRPPRAIGHRVSTLIEDARIVVELGGGLRVD
jgi:hypothetical protein